MRAELRLVVTLALAIVTGVTLMALHRQIYGAGENAQKVQVALARQLVEGFDGTSFLVEAEGTCPAHKDKGALLEPLVLVPVKAAAGASVLDRVRLAIGDQQGITVSELSKGIMLIRWPAVGSDLFRTRISKLDLGEYDQFNPPLALDRMLGTKEVRAAIRRSGHQPYPRIYAQLVNPPLAGLPHLPARLSNESVEGVVAQTLKTFGGVIIYSECSPWFRMGHNTIDYYPPRSP